MQADSKVWVNGLNIFLDNEAEFEFIFDEIFNKKVYHVDLENKKPFIIDCGSHIGLSVLYFKHIYPHSKVLCFEPNRATLQILKKNISGNRLIDVEVINAAVSDRSGIDEMFVPKEERVWKLSSTMSRQLVFDAEKFVTQKIKTVLLSDYITQTVDLLKIDIEGFEKRVIFEIKNKLHFVNNIIIEHHQISEEGDNSLEQITAILTGAGFNVELSQITKQVSLDIALQNKMNWLLIRAKRG